MCKQKICLKLFDFRTFSQTWWMKHEQIRENECLLLKKSTARGKIYSFYQSWVYIYTVCLKSANSAAILFTMKKSVSSTAPPDRIPSGNKKSDFRIKLPSKILFKLHIMHTLSLILINNSNIVLHNIHRIFKCGYNNYNTISYPRYEL